MNELDKMITEQTRNEFVQEMVKNKKIYEGGKRMLEQMEERIG